MQNNTCPWKNMLAKGLFAVIALFLLTHAGKLSAHQIDIGIFASEPDEIEVYIKPDFLVGQNHYIQEIRFTVRWSDPDAEIVNVNLINPYNIQALPVFDIIEDGYRYQMFRVEPVFVTFGSDLQPDEEVLLSSFTHTAGPDVTFELATADVTPEPNMFYFFQIVCNEISGPCEEISPDPVDVTGILYEPSTFPVVTVPITLMAFVITLLSMVGFFFYPRKEK